MTGAARSPPTKATSTSCPGSGTATVPTLAVATGTRRSTSPVSRRTTVHA